MRSGSDRGPMRLWAGPAPPAAAVRRAGPGLPGRQTDVLAGERRLHGGLTTAGRAGRQASRLRSVAETNPRG